MPWDPDSPYLPGLGSALGLYGSDPSPNPASSRSGWQGQQLPAVSTAFIPVSGFPSPTLPSPFSQRAPSTFHSQQGGASHWNEFVRPAIPTSAETHSVPASVRLGPLTNTNAAQSIENLDVDAQNAPSGRMRSKDRDPGNNQVRQVSTRKPRTRQPGEAQWQNNKPHIHKLYMTDGLPLPEVVRLMERDHNFTATEKMYKNKFKVWHWSKHLNQAQANWMKEKITQRRQARPSAATVFEWNHQQWSEDKVMQICGRIAHAQPQTAGPVSYAATPNEMKDIKYWTPQDVLQTPRDVAPTPRDVSAGGPQHRERQQSPTVPRRFYLDDPPVNLEMKRTTISDLRKLLVSAAQAASSGNRDEADADFRDAVSGFRQILSPTHEETVKAAYLYASFYANSGNMDKADAVLSWMTEKHREKWGSEHEKTYLHYARMVELLRSWGLKEQAENLVYKLLEGLDDNDNVALTLNNLSGHQHRRLLENADDLAETFPETDDADAIRHQLDKVELAVMTNITGLEGILQTIIRHCDEGDSEELALQACRAKCALAQRFLCEGKTGDAIRMLKSGKISLDRLLEVDEEPIAHSTVVTARRLALTFFEARDERSCNGVIDKVIVALETRLFLPECRNDDGAKNALLDFVTSTALHFHQKSAWDNCQDWLERALALAMRHFGIRSREALKLQKILQRKDSNMRMPDGLSDLLSFSRGRCVDFPAEKSLLFLPQS